jgi:hypothetical protein
MAKMAKVGFLRTTIEKIEFVIKQPRAKFEEVKKWGAELPERKLMKAVVERHLAILRQNDMRRCLPCQNITTNTLQTCRWRKGKGAPGLN